MATKKFVKSNLFSSNKYTEKVDKPEKHEKQLDKPPWNPENNKRNKQYVQRGTDNNLRKYFQIVSATSNTQIQEIVVKFPMFFSLHSQQCQPISNKFHGRPQRAAYAPPQPQQQENISWDSDGQIQLGAGLDKSSLKKYNGYAPLKKNQLKRYQKQFLEDELRRKTERLVTDNKKEEKRTIQSKIELKSLVVESINKPKQLLDSDDEIQIIKTTNYETRPSQTIQVNKAPSQEHNIMTDQEESDRFKSDSSDSDDVFGDKSDKQQQIQQIEEVQIPKQIGFGSVQFAKGQFGVFALSQGLKADDQIWTMSNGSTISKKFSSNQMDQDYQKVYYQNYPMINFNDYPQYSDYQTFSLTKSIDVFLPSKQQRVVSNYQKYDPTKNKRRLSTTQQYQNDDYNKQRNRRQSAIYKPKNES